MRCSSAADQRFRRYGDLVAGSISAALRVLAHVYQGPLALVTVLPVAVLFTLYYARTRRLWPVIVAHAFQDTLALSLLALVLGLTVLGARAQASTTTR